MNKVKEVIEKANNKNNNRKLNILTFPTHERYETQLCKTGHNFYAVNARGGKKWKKEYASIPENYLIMPEDKLLSYLSFDLILAQSRFDQFSIAYKLRDILKIPLISLEHTTPTPNLVANGQINAMRAMVGDINVFISEYSRSEWGIVYNSTVIKHSVDTMVFDNKKQSRENKVLTVANDFINRDYCLNFTGWKNIVEGLDFTLVGDNPGLSEPTESVEQLVSIYNSHSVFLNSSTFSPIPKSVLEAMSCGCAVVSKATCMIPEVVTHGVEGFISNDEKELKKYTQQLLDNPELARKMGDNARKKILSDFREDAFLENWNKTFEATRSL